MQKLFNFLMVGLTFSVLNVATVAAQAEINPLESNTPPEQQEEMSDFANATDGGAMSAAAKAGAVGAAEESDRILKEDADRLAAEKEKEEKRLAAEKEKEEKKAELAACFVKENQEPDTTGYCRASLLPRYSVKQCIIRTCTEELVGYVDGKFAPENDSWKDHIEAFDEVVEVVSTCRHGDIDEACTKK